MNIAHNTPLTRPLEALRRWFGVTPISAQSPASNDPTLSRPLRVLRVLEVGQAPTQMGRVRISGRMADVCAELDRLASCEARWH